MPETSIQPTASSGGALSAEHYQTFEMAKANDGVIGGSNIAELRSYSAAARAQAQVIHKTIASLGSFEEVAAARAEAIETEQTYARVSIYADQRIGELLRELPTRQGARTDATSSPAGDKVTKSEALQDAGISRSEAYRLEELASNPDVVQAVLDKAEADGRIPSRKQVLDAIRERDEAREEAEQLGEDISELQAEVASLEAQTDQAYENGYKAATRNAQPQVVTREVESEAARKRISELEHLEQLHSSDNQRLRRRLEEMRQELDKAKLLIGEKQRNDSAEWDIAALTTATNNYLRQYGGKAWAFDQFYRVDETTQAEFIKAINNLAAFAQNLAQMIKEQSDE